MATRRPQIRLLEETEDAPSVVGLELLRAELPFMGERLELRVEVPDRRATLAEVVPLARAICDRFTEAAVRCVAKAGRRISCTKGCGVCCTNYLVPMTVPEAFRLLADLRAAAPGERRRLEAAFDAAEETLAASGLLEACRNLDPGDPASGVAQRELAGKWWSERRFPCPLLRDQACSHYASRPIPCREFLVVSPPQRCESNAETRVRRPFSMHAVLSQWAAELEGTRPTLVLLVNFLSWCMQRAERRRRTWRGPQIVRKLLEILTDTAAAADETYRGPVADDREPAAGG